jgi:hypothetical protein
MSARKIAQILAPVPYTDTHPLVTDARPRYRGQFGQHRNGLRAAILRAAADPASELFHRDQRDGVLYRRTGASHRAAFWAGFDSVVNPDLPPRVMSRGEPTSDAATCYAAGQSFGRAVRKSRAAR